MNELNKYCFIIHEYGGIQKLNDGNRNFWFNYNMSYNEEWYKIRGICFDNPNKPFTTLLGDTIEYYYQRKDNKGKILNQIVVNNYLPNNSYFEENNNHDNHVGIW